MSDAPGVEAQQPLEIQDHRCTAVIEELCAATPEDAWAAAE